MIKRFIVGQRVIAEDTEREGIVRELDPGIDADWYAVDFGDVTLIYPHSLLRLAQPAAPPPAQPDDEQVRAIRERLAKVPDEELFVKGNYTYWMVRGKYTGQVVADVPFVIAGGESKDIANFLAAAPDDIRSLLARLDAVQAERDALLRHAISMASALDMEGLDDNDAVRYVKRLMTKESDDANAG